MVDETTKLLFSSHPDAEFFDKNYVASGTTSPLASLQPQSITNAKLLAVTSFNIAINFGWAAFFVLVSILIPTNHSPHL